MFSGDTFKRFFRTLGAAPPVITTTGAMPALGTIYQPTVGTGGTLGSGNGFAEITLSPGIYINTFSFVLNYTGGTYVSSYTSTFLISGTATLPSSTMFHNGGSATTTSFLISGTFFVNVTVTALIRANTNWVGPTNVVNGAGTFWQAIRIG